jgi:hypothetical protein
MLQNFLKIFRRPLAAELAQRQLAEARELILDQRALVEYHSAMATMLEQRIHRLSAVVKGGKP